MLISFDFKDTRYRAALFLFLSLLLHFTMMIMMDRYSKMQERQNRISLNKETDIEYIPSRVRQQIVETNLTNKTDQAKDDAFLGKQTQFVRKQTRAADVAAFRSGKGRGEAGESAPKNEAQENIRFSDLGVKADLKPLGHLNPKDRDAAVGGSATSDYLKEIEHGSQTMLNTREFAYFSFYQRVRHQLEQFWEPGLKYRLKKMVNRGRTLASDQEHATRLLVELNDEGEIIRVAVEDTSGVLDLDQAAIDAFNRAGPFPNPPRGMIGKDGTVKVEWEFILKT